MKGKLVIFCLLLVALTFTGFGGMRDSLAQQCTVKVINDSNAYVKLTIWGISGSHKSKLAIGSIRSMGQETYYIQPSSNERIVVDWTSYEEGEGVVSIGQETKRSSKKAAVKCGQEYRIFTK